MPCEILQAGGAGPGVGTFLLSYSGLTYGGLGNPEALIVIRVNNPLGAVTFTPEFVTIGDIEDIGGAFGFPGLADAPQAGGAALIEVNDRRALDAVWRNGYIYLATTITPNAASDPVNAGQTTAHWVRLDATAVASGASPAGLIVLDQEGNIGGEDIAPGTYTFFPGLAVNSADQLKIGFAASAPSIYGGAYVAGRVPADPPGTVGPSGTVRAGVDYYYRAFGGARNRWGDYSGVAIDPADDGTFWIYNQWADVRGTIISGEDGRWGTAWLECSFSPDAADLVVSDFAAPCCVYEGQQIGAQMFVEVTNNGPGASVACQLGLYVSADSVIDPGDTGLLNGVLAVPALAPGASAVLAVPANVTVPGGLAFGPQFLGALVDNGSAVAETDESNNTASTDAVVNADFYGCARGVASSVLTGDVSVFVVPDGSGDPLNRAQQFAGPGPGSRVHRRRPSPPSWRRAGQPAVGRAPVVGQLAGQPLPCAAPRTRPTGRPMPRAGPPSAARSTAAARPRSASRSWWSAAASRRSPAWSTAPRRCWAAAPTAPCTGSR